MGTPRNVPLLRVLRLVRYLDGMRYAPPLAQLAADFGVCERTIRRDLIVLEEAGFVTPNWRMNERLSGVNRRARLAS